MIRNFHTRVYGHLVPLVFGFIIVSAAVAAYGPFSDVMAEQARLARDGVIQLLEDRLDATIHYRIAAPVILNYVDISDLSIEFRDSEEKIVISRLRIAYDLIGLLFPQTGRPRIHDLIIENATVSLTEERLRSLARNAADLPAGTVGPVRISGRNLRIELKYSGGETIAEKVFFQLTPEEKDSALRLRAVLRGSFGPGSPIRRFETVCTLSGTLSSDLTRTSMVARFSSFATESFTVSKQTVQVNWDRTALRLVSVEGRRPFDASADFDFATGRLSLFLQAQDLDPSNLIRLHGKLQQHDLWLTSTRLSGKLWIDLETRDGLLQYQGRISADTSHPLFRRRATVDVDASGDTRSVNVRSLHAVSSLGSLTFSGGFDFASLLPSGILEVRDLTFFSDEALSARLDLVPKDGNLIVSGESFAFGEWVLYRPTVRISRTREDILIQLEAVLEEQGTGISASLRWRFDGVEAHGDLILAGIPSRRIVPLLARHLPGSLRQSAASAPPLIVSSQLQFEWRRDFLRIDLPFVRLEAEGNPLDLLFAQDIVFMSGDLGPGSFNAGRILLNAGEWNAQGRLDGSFDPNGLVRIASDFTLMQTAYQARLVYRPEGIIEIKGSGGLDARVSWDPQGTLYAWMHADSLELPIAGPPRTVGFDLRANYRSPTSWRVDIDRMEMPDFELYSTNRARLSLAGWAEPNLLMLNSVLFDDGYSVLRGDLSLKYDWDLSRASLLGKLEDSLKRETYDFRLGRIDDLFSLAVSFRNSPLTRVRINGLSGSVSGIATLTVSERGADWTINAAVEDGIFNRDPFQLAILAEKKGPLVSIEKLNGGFGPNRLEAGTARLDMRTGELTGRTVLSTLAEGKTLSVAVDGRVRFAHGLSEFEAPFSLLESDFSGNLNLRSPVFDFAPGGAVGIAFDKTADSTRLTASPGGFLEGRLVHDGSFSLELKEPLPFSAELSGYVRESIIDALVENLSFKVEKVAPSWKMVFVHFLSGECTGRIRISGMINDPDFNGYIRVRNGTGSIDIIPEVLPIPDLELRLGGKELVFDGLTVNGKSTRADLRGRFILDHWQMKSFTMDVDLPIARAGYGTRVKSDFGAVAVDGFAQGLVKITGDERNVTVAGDLLASNTIITLGTNPAYAKPQTDFSVVVSLRFVTGKGNEFFWPSRDLPVLRAAAAIDQNLSILIDGRKGQFGINGDIAIRAGQVNYFSRVFYFREGLIRFNERGEVFDPRLTVRAESREPTADGLARIYLVADNSRLSQFSPRFETDSAMTNTDIMALLNKDILLQDRNKSVNISSAMLLTSDVMSQLGLVRSFEDNMRDRLRLDLFSIRTHVFQNLLREVIQGPAYPLDTGVPSLGKYLDKTSVFLGKYLGTNLFLELLVQFQAIDPLQQQVREFGAVKVESEILLEWKTPFFLLEWSFFPKTWKDLFIPDNTFAFSWKFSY